MDLFRTVQEAFAIAYLLFGMRKFVAYIKLSKLYLHIAELRNFGGNMVHANVCKGVNFNAAFNYFGV